MGALTLLITGAGGYIGRHTVAEARARGHRVIAVIRAGAAPAEASQGDDGVEWVSCDVSRGDGLDEVCARADVVLHLAASMSGDAELHTRDTLEATRNLLAALPSSGRLVLLSSIAVYDMAAVEPGEMITEKTPLLAEDAPADAYAKAKLAQEALVRQAEAEGRVAATILRAGAVFGPGRLWNAHLGAVLGPVLLRLGAAGAMPLCHVSTCAAALVSAAERPATAPLNLIDEDLPDRRRFLKALKNGPRIILPFSWRWACVPAALAASVLPRDRLPGLLRREVLRARFLPVQYDNSRMREVLGIRQAHGFEALMHEAQA